MSVIATTSSAARDTLRGLIDELLSKLASARDDAYHKPIVVALDLALDAIEAGSDERASWHALDALRRVAPLVASGVFAADLLALVADAESARLALFPPPPLGPSRARVDSEFLAAHERPRLRAVARALFDPAPPRDEMPTLAPASPAIDAAAPAADDDAPDDDAPPVRAIRVAPSPVDPDLPRAPGGLLERVDEIGAARPLDAFRADVAHLCLDRVAMLARHRDERALAFRREVEGRLLRHADAALVAGDARIVELAMSFADAAITGAAPNPYALWATIFVLGSLEGGDSLDAIAEVIRRAGDTGCAAVDILSDVLVVLPHPEIGAWTRAQSASPTPLLRAACVATLGRRGQLTTDELKWHLTDPSIPVLRAALHAASRVAVDAAAPLVPMCRAYLAHPDGQVAFRAARTLMLWGFDDAAALLREGGAPAERLRLGAADLLVLRGIAADREAIARSLAGSPPTERQILALGRFGHLDVTAHLLHLLTDEDAQGFALRALTTLFGDSVPPKSELNRATWHAAIAAMKLDPRTRMRCGKPWSAAMVAAECASLDLRRAEVEARIDELAARFGRGVGEAARLLDLAHFAVDSEPAIEAFAATARQEAGGAGAGGWYVR